MDIHLFDTIKQGDAAVMQAQLAQVPEGETVNLLINSPGGSIPEGMAIASLIKNHPSPVKANVIGLAASMATIVSLSADSVNMVDGGIWMIHHPSMESGGNAKQLKEKAELVEAISKPMINIYSKKTGLGKKVISALMDEAVPMVAKKAKELRFIDTISEPLAMVAKMDITNYKDMNLKDLKAKVESFAKDFGFIEATAEEQTIIEAQKADKDKEVADAVAKKVLEAENAEQAINAELVTKGEFAPFKDNVMEFMQVISEYITAQPDEDKLKELQKKEAEGAVSDLLKEMKKKVAIPSRTGSPVLTEVQPFKTPTDAERVKSFNAHFEKNLEKLTK